MDELFRRTRKGFTAGLAARGPAIPPGLCVKCPVCRGLIYRKQLDHNRKICLYCGHYLQLGCWEWITLLDDGWFVEHDPGAALAPPAGRPRTGWLAVLDRLQPPPEPPSAADIILSGVGSIEGRSCVLLVCNFNLLDRTSAVICGELVARAAARAADLGCPLVTVTCSGDEARRADLFFWMQLPGICVSLSQLAANRLPHIALLAAPGCGGGLGSYASLADVVLVECGAQPQGAAGPAAARRTRGDGELWHQPPAELLERGLVDIVAARGELRRACGTLLRLFAGARTAQRWPRPTERLQERVVGEQLQ